MRHLFLAILVVVCGNSAWANGCCTSFDLKKGLRFVFETGFTESFVMRDNGAVESTSFRPNGTRSESRMAVGGIFETSYGKFDAAGENSIYSVEYSYDFPLDDEVPPVIGKSVSGTQTETSNDGSTYQNRYKLDVRAERTITIDGCQFTWWEMEYSYGWWWDHDKDRAMYFPDLGILLGVDFDIPLNVERVRSSKLMSGS